MKRRYLLPMIAGLAVPFMGMAETQINGLPTMPAPLPTAPSASSVTDVPPASPVPPSAPVANAVAAVSAPESSALVTTTTNTIGPPPTYSYGDINFSMFYSPKQIEQMKSVLQPAEDKLARGGATSTTITEEIKPLEQAPPEPGAYPMFKLSSIVFRSVNDWTVWIEKTSPAPGAASPSGVPGAAAPTIPAAANPQATGGTPAGGTPGPAASATISSGADQIIKLTPRSNSGEITVARISANTVEVVWTPDYWKALSVRSAQHLFAGTDHVKHRLVPGATVTYNPGDKEVRFVLHENQVFAAAYFAIFEGSVPNATLASIAPPAPAAGAATGQGVAPTPVVGAGEPSAPDNIDSLLARADKNAADKTAASATTGAGKSP